MEKKRSIQGKPRSDAGEHVDRTPKCSTRSRSGVGSKSGLDSRLIQKEPISLLSLYFIYLFPFSSITQSDSSHFSINNYSKVFSRSSYPEVICNSSKGPWGRLSAGFLSACRVQSGKSLGKP